MRQPAAACAGGLEARNLSRLRGFVDCCELLQARSPPISRPLLLPMQEERDSAIARDDADALTLCTIHQAKGREWPVVFVPRLCEDELPLQGSNVEEVTHRRPVRRPLHHPRRRRRRRPARL